MEDSIDFETVNEAKANMDHIYNQPDPRLYYGELRRLGYVIPGLAKPIFRKLVSLRRRNRTEPVQVLDLGCSYGVNAALLKHDLSMSELYDHWNDDACSELAPAEVAARDRHFFADLDGSDDIRVVGLDQAEAAVNFAEEAGLLDDAIAVNLEVEPLPEAAREGLASIDLVTSTGCVGYVTEKTFERLLPAVAHGRPPWIANFVLRLFPYDAIEATLARSGYVTEKLEGRTFAQRRFASADERESMLGQLRARGVDPDGRETEGELHAEFYLSRPMREAAEHPIERLLAA